MTNEIMFMWKKDGFARFVKFNTPIHDMRYKDTRPYKMVIGTAMIDPITDEWIRRDAMNALGPNPEIIYEEFE